MDHFWVCANEKEGARSPSLCSISVNRAQFPHQRKLLAVYQGNRDQSLTQKESKGQKYRFS